MAKSHLNNLLLKNLSRISVTNFFYIPLLFAILMLGSCDKESVVGLDVQPENDLLNVIFTDSLTLITQSKKEDSLKTDESVLLTQIALLGKYIDPNFGTTTSSIYTTFKLSTSLTSTSFGTNPTIDSVVLCLVYDTTCYGKKDRKQQTVDVYQVIEDMPIATQYFSNKSLAVNTVQLATKPFIPKPYDSVLVWGKKEKPQLRIKLDNNFGQTILNNQGTGNLVDNAALQSFIKGLYITTENSPLISAADGNIMTFKMGDSQTKLRIYYQNNAADSLIYDFGFSGVSRFLNFKHDYAGANVDAALAAQLTSTTINQNGTVYVQSLAGVKVKVEMPHLYNLNDSGAVGINKAELVIKADVNSSYFLDSFAAPKALVLQGINNDGTTYSVPDAFEGSNYYGGTYSSTSKEYRFNITRYIQQVLSGKKENNGFYILASSGAATANRIVLGGGAPGTYQMKLNITYTKIH